MKDKGQAEAATQSLTIVTPPQQVYGEEWNEVPERKKLPLVFAWVR
jgi:hypothetical protein